VLVLFFVEMEGVARSLFTLSELFATDYEKSFDHHFMHNWVASNGHLFFGSVAVYLVFCFVGTTIMKDRKPYDLKLLLAAWNAFLAIFSLIGMCRTVPFLLGRLLTESYESSICRDPTKAYGDGTVGFWTVLFILSKVPELIDTVFIVLRKKPLIFLHWYHHATVLLYCWHAYSTRAGSGLYFIAMNYSVHGFMYAYFCAQALNLVPKSFPAYIITIFQITQMIVGTVVCASAWYYMFMDRPCDNDLNNLRAGAVMYASYLCFFVDFAVRRFIFPSPRAPKAKKEN
jgi:elongation of very long chain fatty acids protein 6